MNMFNKGDIVKYSDKWCAKGEEKYIFVVLETGLSFDRIKIGALNSRCSFGYVELVEPEMIQLVDEKAVI